MMIEEAVERLRDRVTIGEFVERMDLDWDEVIDALTHFDILDEKVFSVFEDELNDTSDEDFPNEDEENVYSTNDL